jgi:hypothetical protein
MEKEENPILITAGMLKLIANKNKMKISIECQHNGRNYLKMYKNFGKDIGTRTKNVPLSDLEVTALTTNLVLTHVAQFIHPLFSF